MDLPKDTTVAVADGAKLVLFRNTGTASEIRLQAVPAEVDTETNAGSGARHQNSAANPSESQAAEDNFAAGIATLLNSQVESNQIENLVVIAAPRTLGELRKHYSKQLSQALVGEISKDLTGHTTGEIEQALKAA